MAAKKVKDTTGRSVGITRFIYYSVLLALITSLVASVSHLAQSIQAYESESSSGVISYAIAIAVEFGMLSLSMGMADRRRRKEKFGGLMLGLIFFGLINMYGNLHYSLANHAGVDRLTLPDLSGIDILIRVSIGVFSGILPVLAISLTELQSLFLVKLKSDEKAHKVAEDLDRRKEEQKTRRDQKRLNKSDTVAVRGLKDEAQETVVTVTPPPAEPVIAAVAVPPVKKNFRHQENLRQQQKSPASQPRETARPQEKDSHTYAEDPPDVFERSDTLNLPLR